MTLRKKEIFRVRPARRDALVARAETLRSTLVRQRLLDILSELQKALLERGLGPGSDDPIRSSLEEVGGFIRDWSYLRPTSHPLEVTVDPDRRLYRLRWNEGGCEGWCEDKFAGVEIPFAPKMNLEVAVVYDPVDGGRFGYRVENHEGSAASIQTKLWLEGRFFSKTQLQALARIPFPEAKIPLADGWMWLGFPGRGLHFELLLFDQKTI